MADDTKPDAANARQQHGIIKRCYYWFRDHVPDPAVSSAVATIALVFVGIWGVLETDHTLELSERAWISLWSAHANFVVSGHPMGFTVQYVNTGKEPATDLNFKNAWTAIAAPSNDDFAFIENWPENKTCEGLEPKPGIIAPPGASSIHTTDTARGDPYNIDEEVLSGKKYVIVTGCIAYRTFGKVHRSAYCYVFEIKRFPSGNQSLPVGQVPDPNSPAGPSALSSPSDTEPTRVSVYVPLCNGGAFVD